MLDGPAAELARRALQLCTHIRAFQHSIAAVEHPVIAAAHGITLGLSIDIMSVCDVRYAASTTIFVIKEADVGLATDIGALVQPAAYQSPGDELAYTVHNLSVAKVVCVGFASRVVLGGRDDIMRTTIELADFNSMQGDFAYHAADNGVSCGDIERSQA